MKSTVVKFILAVSAGCVLIQLGTPPTANAADAQKNDQKPDPVAQTPMAGMMPQPLMSLAVDSAHFSRYAILVDKKRRTLTVWENQANKIKLVGAFAADIGAQEGDKVAEGDYKTPEGIYFFQTTTEGVKVDFSQYGVRIFTMDYPNYFDRLEKKTGKGIWLHAIPDSKSLLRGSRGCVVVRNSVIADLAKYIELKKTTIVVLNQVDYLAEAEWLAQQGKLKAWLETWRLSWGSKDLDKYMDFYSPRFQSNHMDKVRWRAYKKRLNEKYTFIDIDLKDVQIFTQGTKVVFRFIQNYKSDRKIDVGAKIVYALKSEERFEIIGENWEPLTRSVEAR